ncbi:MAG: cupin domain-containing protein [Gammaproteobacteria bacterium]|jgi:mannose-6-phosphate isomerase-like protein (cupin superfamily)|nr:cupin domain-containing protein [Gammaproteobacteria bacterium]
MNTPSRSAHVSFQDALSKGEAPEGELAVPIFSHGTLEVELYTPVGHDMQTPHTRDEIYFVARGKGQFFDGSTRYAVAAGSFLFVPAGQVHRFETFSPDFAVWVVFYGPEGGESE